MARNVGRFDQVLRFGIGLGLIYVGLIDEQFIKDPLSSYIIAAIGILNMSVSLIRYCPLYVIVGINTCPSKKNNRTPYPDNNA
jgi:hypothetical protein